MKKILVTRRLLQSNEERLKQLYDVRLNSNDELYSQQKLIQMSEGCDGILSALTDKLDEATINKLPSSIKILSNFEGINFTSNLDVIRVSPCHGTAENLIGSKKVISKGIINCFNLIRKIKKNRS